MAQTREEAKTVFLKGEHIVYGSYGLCEIMEVGQSPLDASDSRTFFTLRPVYAPKGSVIFTPVENEAVLKRAPMTREEANALLDKALTLPTIAVEKEKYRREIYRSALQKADPELLVSILRTVLERRAYMSRMGRRLTDADTDYEKKARDNLVGELSLALELSEKETSQMLERLLGAEGLY